MFRTMIAGLFVLSFLTAAALEPLEAVSASFTDGEVVSASAFNDLFGLVETNFTRLADAVTDLEADVGAAAGFVANVTAEGCAAGQFVTGVSESGELQCQALPPGSANETVFARASIDTTQLAANTQLVFAEFSHLDFGSPGTYSSATPDRLFVTRSGLYYVAASVTMLAANASPMGVHVNGSLIPLLASGGHQGSTGTNTYTTAVSGLLMLQAGDYIRVGVRQYTGVAASIIPSAASQLSLFLLMPQD